MSWALGCDSTHNTGKVVKAGYLQYRLEKRRGIDLEKPSK
jgi:hypothetical protein